MNVGYGGTREFDNMRMNSLNLTFIRIYNDLNLLRFSLSILVFQRDVWERD